MIKKKHTILISLALFAYSYLLYVSAHSFEFAYFDDHIILLQQEKLFGPGPIRDNLSAILFDALPREEPLIVRDLSWLIDAKLFGFDNPFGYHFTNTLYHCLTVVFAFLFLLLFTEKWLPSAFAAFLYASLAVHGETVGWIMGRKDILAGMFLFLLLITEVLFQKSERAVSKVALYATSIVLVGLACLSKMSSVVYPAVLFLVRAFYMFKGNLGASEFVKNALRSFVTLIPHFALALMIFVWYQGVLQDYGLFARAIKFSASEKIAILLLVDPFVLLKYLELVFYPSHLSSMYDWVGMGAAFEWYDQLIAMSLVAGVILTGLYLLRKKTQYAVLYFGFFILLIPYANLVHFGWWYANRYIYSAALFLIALPCFATYDLYRVRKTVSVAIAVTFLMVLALGKNITEQVEFLEKWKSGEALYKYELAESNGALVWKNWLLGYYLTSAQFEPDQQIEKLKTAEKLAHDTLGGQQPDKDPYEIAKTFYMLGRIQKLTNQPYENQLQSLLNAYKYDPAYNLTSLGLAEIYFTLALEEEDEQARLSYGNNTVKYLLSYFEHTASSPAARALKAQIQSQMKTEFPELAKQLDSVY